MTTSENNNGNNTLLIALILSLIFAIFLTSCGSRKVAKSETKEQEQTEVKSNIKTETKIIDNTKIVDTSVTDEIEFIPIDFTKEIIVNGKKYFQIIKRVWKYS
jgi:Na+-transporting NADH:ubiquinone oxidoreductase subunit NqrC